MSKTTRNLIAIFNAALFISMISINAIKPNTINHIFIGIMGLFMVTYNAVLAHYDLRAATLENNQAEIKKLKTLRFVFIALGIFMLVSYGMVLYSSYQLSLY